MKKLIAIGAAGSLGALARTLLGLWLPAEGGFPAGTLAANVAGAFILCFLAERARQWIIADDTAYDAVTVGFLGSFTTFSTFSAEAFHLFETDWPLAAVYMITSVAGGLAAGALGFLLGGRRVSA
ncbi:hypothetical protein NCCP2716_19340 [Sporosarcina sp. NCCP-2716]|uniref:fluoride efflux transporter FluC n=1 Tax=Sporosarcina sp. NCCP-2716 TaxID=2943679 RepID=UPI00203C129F|nr:CrcB family protein [Sporosarcina sp. NCCP-2716]GKV69436.1 hypothetical protein NCCP2716_19340 [Sporosarcina sp. NCCP-2716]